MNTFWKAAYPIHAFRHNCLINIEIIFIGPRSDHSLPMSLTHSLTHWLTDDLVEDWMNWPKGADYADYVDYADFAEYA